MNTSPKATCGQLERNLAQSIQKLYREQLGHQPSKVTCQLFAEKLVVIIEDSITTAEELLVEKGQESLATEVRANLDEAIKPQLKELIENILDVSVTDLLSDATLQTGRTGVIVMLSSTPEVRNPEAIPKVKK